MDTQTVFQVGNSLAVTIPSKVVRKLGWVKGKKVYISHDSVEGSVKVSERPVSETGLDKDFFKWKEDFIKKNTGLLKKLSRYHGT